jgi:hypothetical protein
MAKRVHDQFSDLKISRQKRYQLRRAAQGKCVRRYQLRRAEGKCVRCDDLIAVAEEFSAQGKTFVVELKNKSSLCPRHLTERRDRYMPVGQVSDRL